MKEQHQGIEEAVGISGVGGITVGTGSSDRFTAPTRGYKSSSLSCLSLLGIMSTYYPMDSIPKMEEVLPSLANVSLSINDSFAFSLANEANGKIRLGCRTRG